MKIKHLLFIVTIVFINSCSKNKEAAKETKIPKVEITEITTNNTKETLSYSGTIEADNTVSLGFSVAGRVANIYVEEGQIVKKGQLLATIDAITYQNVFDIANAGLTLANDNYNRLNELYEKGSLPARDYIAVKVSVAQANANKNLAAKNLADTKLYAPFSGMITNKITEIGATVAPGIPAFTVMKTDVVYAKASISESEISKLKIGANAFVNIPSMDTMFVGKIAIINHSADLVTRTFMVKVRLKNTENNLLPGMISTINLNTENIEKVISVPANVIVRDVNDITYVFVLENNVAIKKRVTTGNFRGNEVVITEGLKAGDQLIVKGYTQIKDGETVSL